MTKPATPMPDDAREMIASVREKVAVELAGGIGDVWGSSSVMFLCDAIVAQAEQLAAKDAEIAEIKKALAIADEGLTAVFQCGYHNGKKDAGTELDVWKTHAANHVETLRGVRDLCKKGDMERAIRWVTDGLSGYTDDGESVLLMVSDQRNKAEAELAKVLEWARGYCSACGNAAVDGDCAGDDGKGSPCVNWTPAWEVK